MNNSITRNLLALLGILFLQSCAVETDYLKHDISYEKIGECKNINSKIDITANTIGERYIFQECLDASYQGAYEVNRMGDTVVVSIPVGKPGSGALYKVTLDINTRPAYNYLSLNGSVFPVSVNRY